MSISLPTPPLLFNHCRGKDSTIAVLEASGPNASTATLAICGVSWGPDFTFVTEPIKGSDDRALVIRDNDHFRILIPNRAREHAIRLAEEAIASDYEKYQGVQLGFSDVTGGGGRRDRGMFVLHRPMSVLTLKGANASEMLAPFHTPRRKFPHPQTNPLQFISVFKLDGRDLGYLIDIAPDEYCLVFEESDLYPVEAALTLAGFSRCTFEDLESSGCELFSLLSA